VNPLWRPGFRRSHCDRSDSLLPTAFFGILSTLARFAGGGFDGCGEGGEVEVAAEAVAEVVVGAHAMQLGGLHDRREDIHRAGAAAVQAHVAAASTHAGLQLRGVVVKTK